MKALTISAWPDLKGQFNIDEHGKIRVRKCTSWFGFQIRARNSVPHPALLFALLHQNVNEKSADVMFGVRVDLENGEISDIANHTGIIGTLEEDLWPNHEEEFPIMMRWEVEHTGDALIPRLHIGSEEWLYPSVLFPGDSNFIATTGQDRDQAVSSSVFSPGYVWCQDRLK